MSFRKSLMAGGAIITLLAFEARAEVAAGEPAATLIEEVVVTAEKRAVNLQEVPVAVSAYTSETRDLIGIRTIQDMANFTPGLSYSTSLDRISLRGVGRLTNEAGSDPGVATYNDGFYTSSTVEASKSPMFVERVEVLRGPQGTLYGRNSVGGAINVISKRPTKDFSGEVRLMVGNYDYKLGEAWVSGPITDSLRYRFSAQAVQQTEGYFENIAGGPEEGGVTDRRLFELQIGGEIGENFEYWFKASTATWDDRSRSGNLIDPYATGALFPTSTTIVANPGFGYATVNPGVTDHSKFNTDTPSTQKLDDNQTYVAELIYHFDRMDLKYVGGYQTYLYTQISDTDGISRNTFTTTVPFLGPQTFRPTYVTEYIEDKSYYSNELNLSSKSDGKLQWIAGLYQYHEEYFQPYTLSAPNQTQLQTPFIFPSSGTVPIVAAAANPRGIFYRSSGDLTTDSTAVFGQIDYAFADDWSVTLGLRYSKDEKEALHNYRVVGYNPSNSLAYFPAFMAPFMSNGADFTPGGAGGPINVKRKGSWDAVSGRLEIDWQPDVDTLAYASYSRGFKAGGFNLLSAPATGPGVKPETVDAFEFGLKKDFSPSLRFNGALFYYGYHYPQVPLPTLSGGIVSNAFINIEESRSFGAEVETTWFPIEPLRLTLSYAYLDSTIREGCCYVDESDPQALDAGATPTGGLVGGRQPQSLIGNRMPASPRNKIALNALYTMDFQPGSLSLSTSYVWKDEAWYGVFQTERFRAPSSEQIDLRATWKDAQDRYTLIAFGRNITDRAGVDGVSAGTGTGASGYGRSFSYVPPRTYGVELQISF